MNTADLRRFLRSLPAFERFSERSLDALATNMHLENYPAGHILTVQGQCGAAMYMVISGRIDVARVGVAATFSPEHGENQELAEGAIVGLLSFANIPSLGTCTCKDDVQLASLSREDYEALFSQAPGAAHQMQYMLAVRLAQVLQTQNRSLRQALHNKTAPKKSESLLKRWFG